jgi:mannose-1-phosphate guanylyltransferase
MFFFRASLLLDELRRLLPATAAAAADSSLYPSLPSISIDHGVMEKTAKPILYLRGDLGWNDVGSWSALADYRYPDDDQRNIKVGDTVTVDAHDNIIVADEGTVVAVVGVSDLVVVRSGNAVLIVPRDRAQDVRDVVRALEQRKQEPYL